MRAEDNMNEQNLFRRSLSLVWQRWQERWLLRRPLAQMYHLIGGHIYFQTLSSAVQLDLFTLLARRGALTRAQIAGELKLAEKPTRILLLGLVTLGLLRHRGGAYTVTRLADQMFNRDRPRNIADIVLWQHFINYRAMAHFHEALHANRNVGLREFAGDEPTLYQRLAHDPHLEKIFQDAMQAISRQANHLLAEAMDFSHIRHVVDVGGGNGTNIIRLAQRYPHLKADVFDSPSVCAIAREKIKAAGLSDRLGAVPGNCFEHEFPAGVDCILFCHFMTIWSEENNQALLKKACRALAPGGVVVVFNQMQHDAEDGPLSAALGSPYFLTLATGEGMLYTWNEYAQWMRAAGFARVVRRALIRDHGLIIGIK
jgi:ubiquinone/menaquinone biosynthesis C-methylase UbiE